MGALPVIVVVGLGPADADLLTEGTRRVIDGAIHRFVRTSRHPGAAVVAPATSFDDVYESHESFDDVYRSIVESLVGAAIAHGEVLYAVPGSPVVAETTVEMLLADPRVKVHLVPAMSFLDLAWVRLGVDPHANGVRIVDGHRFSDMTVGERGPLLVSQCHCVRVLSDIKLSRDGDLQALPDVTVLHHLGLPDESVTTVAWHDLDRLVAPDHLTSLWIPGLPALPAGTVQHQHRLQQLGRVVGRLVRR